MHLNKGDKIMMGPFLKLESMSFNDFNLVLQTFYGSAHSFER